MVWTLPTDRNSKPQHKLDLELTKMFKSNYVGLGGSTLFVDHNDPDSLDNAALLPPETSAPTPPRNNIREFLFRRKLSMSGFHPINQQKLKMFEWMKRLGYCLAVLTFCILLVAIPVLTVHAIREYNVGLDIGAFYSAGAFVILTIPISMYEIFLHLTHWYMPDIQKYVVRILWMVPLYSIQSWLSLRYHEFSLYIDTLRDMYEAFVIQSFLYYLVELLGGEDVLARTLSEKAEEHHGEHGWCLDRMLKKWEMGEEFMLQCKHGVLQYVVIKVLATIITFMLKVAGEYGEGAMDLTKGYFYIAFVTNFSQMYALYVLVKLFYATKHELTHPVDWHPVGKFLCVKGVVFFTWWQGLGISILQDYGIINDLGHWTAEDVATGLQDYLVCLEMVFFAVAHTFTFTYKEYTNEFFTPDPDLLDNPEDGTYRAPVVRRLAQPLHFSRALWSSTIPSETFSDIYRLQGGARSAVTKENGKGIDLNVIKDDSL